MPSIAQKVSNWLLGEFKVRATRLGDDSLLQHVVMVDEAGLPTGGFISGSAPVLVSIGTTDTLILAANSSRNEGFVQNISDTEIQMSLHTSITLGTAFIIGPSEIFKLPTRYTGAVRGIHASTGTKDVIVWQG